MLSGPPARWPVAVALLTAAACGGRGETDGARPAESRQVGSVSHTGEIRVVGSTPTEQVVLYEPDRDRTIPVTGEWVQELRAVAGAIVTVRGEPARGGAIRVTGYRILEIAGRRPAVGVVRPVEGGIAIEREGGELRLYAPPEPLLQLTGARIWVIPDSSGGVLAYGIIRQP